MGTLFGDPHNKDYSILGSILGSPYFGKLPYELPFLILKVFKHRLPEGIPDSLSLIHGLEVPPCTKFPPEP